MMIYEMKQKHVFIRLKSIVFWRKNDLGSSQVGEWINQ